MKRILLAMVLLGCGDDEARRRHELEQRVDKAKRELDETVRQAEKVLDDNGGTVTQKCRDNPLAKGCL